MRRVVITGMDAISPIGNDLATIESNLRNGRSGIDSIDLHYKEELPVQIAGAIKEFDASAYIKKKERKRLNRFLQISIVNGLRAFAHAGLDACAYDANRFGIVYGSGIGGVNTLLEDHCVMLNKGWQYVGPFHIPMTIANEAAGYLAIKLSAHGPNKTPVNACATGTIAIGDAFHIIKHGYADIMLAGAAESAMNPLSFTGFYALQSLADERVYDTPQQASRPFDKARTGFVIGEGAAAVVLEERQHALERNATIYGEIVGYGASSDAYHITAPDPRGLGAVLCMQWALADGGVSKDQINYINAHGTSTPLNDKTETKAIKSLFGERAYSIPVNATKSMTGHLLGAAGAFETIAILLQINSHFLHPTINQEQADPECDLDYVANSHRQYTIEYALSNSFGFGGQNGSLLICRYKD